MSSSNTLEEMFSRCKSENRAALIPYLTAGYPNPSQFVELAMVVLDSGADALEIGIPFSDPLLDGPAIQRSQHVALTNGVSPSNCLELAREIRSRSSKPLVFMGAYNPILAYGPESFCKFAAESGVSALIVPDLPFEEQQELEPIGRPNDLRLIQLVAPTTSAGRLQKICSSAKGFIYCISVTGVTGARSNVVETARPLVEKVKEWSDVPIAVGFGINGPEQAAKVSKFADGVIVGSALINLITRTNQEAQFEAVQDFISELRGAM